MVREIKIVMIMDTGPSMYHFFRNGDIGNIGEVGLFLSNSTLMSGMTDMKDYLGSVDSSWTG